MAKIELNKPLFETEDSIRYQKSEEQTKATATPPMPRAGMFSRIGAFIIDILLLHCVLMSIALFGHEYLMKIGFATRWIGFLVGLFYFTVGYSFVTGGRTLGKVLLHLQLSDLEGMPLPLRHSFLRACLVMWPFALYILVGQYSDNSDMNPEIIGWRINIWIVAAGAILSWGLANLLFSALDQCGRSVFDYMSSCVQCNALSSGDEYRQFMKHVYEQKLSDPIMRRPLFALVFVTIAIPGLIGWILYRDQQRLESFPQQERDLLIEYRKSVNIPGFRFVSVSNRQPDSASDTTTTSTSAADTETSVSAFTLVTRNKTDLKALESNPKVIALPKTMADSFSKGIARAMNNTEYKDAISTTSLPKKMKFRAGFMEMSDLFFAWNVQEVFAVSEIVSLDYNTDSTTQTASQSK